MRSAIIWFTASAALMNSRHASIVSRNRSRFERLDMNSLIRKLAPAKTELGRNGEFRQAAES